MKIIKECGKVLTFGKLDTNEIHSGFRTLMFMQYPEKADKIQFRPATIYIPSNKKCRQWLKEQMAYNDEQFMLEVCSLISHEMLHIVLFNNISEEACHKIDNSFGICWRDDWNCTHGLMHLKGEFKPRKNKLKNW